MIKLSPQQLKQIRDLLIECAPFRNERQLRPLFADPRIISWQSRIPTGSENFFDLVNGVVELLRSKHSTEFNENGLLLFLQVVAEQIDAGDLCHQQLDALISELQIALTKQQNDTGARLNSEWDQIRVVLFEILESRFNQSELQDISFRLNVEYENLAGFTRTEKARALILHMERRGRLEELVTTGKHQRPEIPWPPLPIELVRYAKLEPKPPIEVQKHVGDLLIGFHGQEGRWQLQASNQGNVTLRQVNIVFRPTSSVTVAPVRLLLGTINAQQIVQAHGTVVIRPNQAITGGTCQLAFELVYQTPQRMERFLDHLLIPL